MNSSIGNDQNELFQNNDNRLNEILRSSTRNASINLTRAIQSLNRTAVFIDSKCVYLNFDTIKTIFVEDVAKLEDISNERQFC